MAKSKSNKKSVSSNHPLSAFGYVDGSVSEFLTQFGYDETTQTPDEFCQSTWGIELKIPVSKELETPVTTDEIAN